jgi:hypothetical protein
MSFQIRALLILSVTLVLLTLLLIGTPAWTVVFAVVVILVSLIMVIGEGAQYLPTVLRVILKAFSRLLRP